MSENRDQMTEVRIQRIENRGQLTEIRGQKSEVRRLDWKTFNEQLVIRISEP
jgi:outer membrane biogenesis lipoprotein LolB